MLDELHDHVAKNGTHGIEALISMADIGKSDIVEKNLLHNEDSHSLAQLRSSLHNTQAEGDYLRTKEKVDHFSRVILDKRANNTKGGEAKVLERARLGGRVEEGV